MHRRHSTSKELFSACISDGFTKIINLDEVIKGHAIVKSFSQKNS